MSGLSFHNIGLPAGHWRAVEKKARHCGETAPGYVRALIERDLLADQGFEEILRPVRQDFREAGVSPEQLEVIVERARRASAAKIRRARR